MVQRLAFVILAHSLTDHLICALRSNHVRKLRPLMLRAFLALPGLAHKAPGARGLRTLALVMGHYDAPAKAGRRAQIGKDAPSCTDFSPIVNSVNQLCTDKPTTAENL